MNTNTKAGDIWSKIMWRIRINQMQIEGLLLRNNEKKIKQQDRGHLNTWE